MQVSSRPNDSFPQPEMTDVSTQTDRSHTHGHRPRTSHRKKKVSHVAFPTFESFAQLKARESLRLTRAIVRLFQAENLCPNLFDGYGFSFNIALNLMSNGYHNEAIDWIRTGINNHSHKMSPTLQKLMLADCYLFTGENEEAFKQYGAVLKDLGRLTGREMTWELDDIYHRATQRVSQRFHLAKDLWVDPKHVHPKKMRVEGRILDLVEDFQRLPI